jgi:hypothetical protein
MPQVWETFVEKPAGDKNLIWDVNIFSYNDEVCE